MLLGCNVSSLTQYQLEHQPYYYSENGISQQPILWTFGRQLRPPPAALGHWSELEHIVRRVSQVLHPKVQTISGAVPGSHHALHLCTPAVCPTAEASSTPGAAVLSKLAYYMENEKEATCTTKAAKRVLNTIPIRGHRRQIYCQHLTMRRGPDPHAPCQRSHLQPC